MIKNTYNVFILFLNFDALLCCSYSQLHYCNSSAVSSQWPRGQEQVINKYLLRHFFFRHSISLLDFTTPEFRI